jgi:phospholipid/cholesterol/gamma-HCH transport system permease protein
MMAVFALSRLNRFRDAQIRLQLHRQISSLGLAALPVALSLAAITGALAVTQVNALAGQNNDAAQRILSYGLFFELAPLLSAMVVLARSGAAIASELAVMHLHNEFVALRRMGIPATDFLLLPRIWAGVLVVPTIAVMFQGVCLVSGCLATAFLQDQPLLQIAERFLDFSDPWFIFLSVVKTAIMGALIGIISCHHGCSTERSAHSISDAGIHAVGNGLVAVFLVDMAFAATAFALR